MGKYKHVKLDADALRRGGASAVLAVEPSLLEGGMVRMLAEEPEYPFTIAMADADGRSGREAQAAAAAGKPQKGVGIVSIDGPLAQKATVELCAYVDGYDAIAARFDLAMESMETSAVLLRIDSPGGDVAGLEQGVARMLKSKEKYGKKVVAFVDELAASAAYRIASGVADEIVIPPAGRVGSIGVIAARVDLSGAAEKAGEKWTVMRSPKGKAAGMPLQPIADIADERMRADVDEAQGSFTKAVADSRGLLTKEVRALNGAVFAGKAAIAQGLADHIDTLEGALARTQKPIKRGSKKQASGDDDMKLTQAIAGALGLNSTEASETDAIEAFAAFEKSLLATTKAPTLRASLAEVEKMAETNAAHKAAAEAHAAAQLELENLKAATALAEEAAKIESILVAGEAARKVTPAKRASLAEKGAKNGSAWLQSLVEELPTVAGGDAPAPKPAATTAPELSERELAMCAELGLDPKTYAASRPAKKA